MSAIEEQVRAGWNEDANSPIGELLPELKRLPLRETPVPGVPHRPRRALEISCSSGRVLRPVSMHFDQIYGVHVSDATIAKAREELSDVPNAFLYAIGGSNLEMFTAEYFDFVYSGSGVLFSDLREIVRVLRPGGVVRLQFSLRSALAADQIHSFTRECGVELLALTGADSEHMWTTWRKPDTSRSAEAAQSVIRTPCCALSGEGAVPASGSDACVAVDVENLPEACDLNSLAALVDEVPGRICDIGPVGGRGGSPIHISRIHIFLPANVRTGMVPLRLEWRGRQLGGEATVRVIRPGPAVRRLADNEILPRLEVEVVS